ncbi:MAG: rhomboid family intramembrane serine protease [Ferruginibacter sp.]
MPKQEQTIPVSNLKKEDILAIAFSTFKKLEWEIKFAGEDKLLGHSPKSWRTYGEEIIITANDNFLTISSELKGNAMFDMMGKNKKRIAAFAAAFESEKKAVNPASLERNHVAVQDLQSATRVVAEKEIKNAKEVDAVMNLSKGNLYVTYSIMAINVIVFVIMCIKGVSVFAPTGLDIINWGGNYGPLTLTGDWWRLITCVFVHIGIIHIAFNMYALYMVGVFLEPMLGKLRYTAAYLATGILSSVVSLWWHTTPLASAGASGAIFGMFGVFLALLLTNLIPKQVRNGLLQSIGILVGYNLLYGMKSGVDNSAHVGGLISGLVIGFFYYLTLRKPATVQRIAATSLAILVASILIAERYIHYTKTDLKADSRTSIENEIKDAGYKDFSKFNEFAVQLDSLDRKGIAVYFKKNASIDSITKELNNITRPTWEKASGLLEKMSILDINPKMHQRTNTLKKYVDLRKEEVNIYEDVLKNNTEENNQRLTKVRDDLSAVIKGLQ